MRNLARTRPQPKAAKISPWCHSLHSRQQRRIAATTRSFANHVCCIPWCFFWRACPLDLSSVPTSPAPQALSREYSAWNEGLVKGSVVPPSRFWKICAPAFRPPQAGGALSGGPAQLLSRFRTGKVRLGGTAAPGHAGAHGCPECPASHPPPTCLLPALPWRPRLGGIRLAVRFGFIPKHSIEAADPPLDLA